ncbi:MAG: nuclease-related domain-containing protein [Deltaproteobacteria bacterium]
MKLTKKKGKKTKKSPLKDKPLREAGQSTQQQIFNLANVDFLPIAIAAIFLSYFAILEWWRDFRNLPPAPIQVTIIALIFIGYSIYKYRKTKKELEALKLGRDGEKEVAAELENLKEIGCSIFHDIVGSGFNLDHVIISEKGIFVVETKTRSKPVKGNPKIIYDGSVITADGHILNPDPVAQVNAGAGWLKNVLKESTGKYFSVKSAVVFPGWFVENKVPPNSNTALVLNPKLLCAYIKKLPDTISREDKHLAAYHISRYIRVNYQP